MGEGAGLIKDNGIRFGCGFQKLAALDGDMLPPGLRMADMTARGIASFKAQEKSTMSTDRARVTFRVRSKSSRLPAKV